MNCQNCDAPVLTTDEWCQKCGAKLLRHRVFLGVPRREEFTLTSEEVDNTSEAVPDPALQDFVRAEPAASSATVAPPLWGGFFPGSRLSLSLCDRDFS